MELQTQNRAQLDKGGKMITQHNEILEIFSDHYTKFLRYPKMKSNTRKYIWKKKQND